MNKQDLVEFIASSTDESKAAASRSLEAILGGILKGLKQDKKVQIVGFGTFAIKNRKARTGRNPATGQTIKIKASKTVGFKAGADLKSKI